VTIEEVFKEADAVQRCGIGVPLALFADVADPVVRLSPVDDPL